MSATATLSYVYAVTWPAAGVPRGAGVADGALGLVEHGRLAAVTSPVPSTELRARRRDLLRHAEVVQQAFERGTVVPLRFGAVVDDVAGELLEPRHEELVALLRSLDGLAEVTVRAFYREDDVLRVLLAEQPALARMRETAPPVQLGEAVARALAARRDSDADAIVRSLGTHAREVAVDERRTELEVVRAAFLVERRKLAALDAEAERVARSGSATTVFKVTGPLPPHHFVDLETGGR